MKSMLVLTNSLVLILVLAAAGTLRAQTYTVLYTYPGTDRNNSGVLAPQIMSQGRDGNLYSTIATNGIENAGTVYQMTTSGQYTALYNFCVQTKCADGAYPQGGVVLGYDGNFYGTTQGGGTGGAGTAFRLTPSGTLTNLWSFGNQTDDSVPNYTLLPGQDGNLYGVSIGQYNGQYGAFFRITPADKFSVLLDFNFTDGAVPNLPTQGTDGNFYGTAELGGSSNLGVIYKITPTGKITVLHNFAGYPSDGGSPVGILVQGSDGSFYGATYRGGTKNQGTIFKISPSGKYTLLYSFNDTSGNDGIQPLAGLTRGSDGSFYGAASSGGTKNAGAIFKVTPAGQESVLLNFCDPTCNGFSPQTPLVQHTTGAFYGNTTGNSLGGSVFYRLDLGLPPFVNMVNWEGKVGGTVEILGQGFTSASKVTFNGVPATFTAISDTFLTATIPAGATTGLVSVKEPGGTLKSTSKFLVTPVITNLDKTSGPVGTTVVITGQSFTQAVGVGFGDRVPAQFTVNSDTQVTAVVPVGAKTGPVGVKTPGGTAISKQIFTLTQ